MLFENTNGNVQEISNQMMIFDTKANKTFQKSTNIVYLSLLLSGSFYFAIKGLWSHALVYAVLAVITLGITWLIFLLFAPEIRKQFIQRILGRDHLFVISSNVKS